MKKSKAIWGSILVVGLLAVTVFVIYSAVKPSGTGGTVDYSRADLTPSDAWYVTDAAGVLSTDTEAWLAALGDDLYHNVDECDLVVVTVNFTGNKSTEDYAYDLFNDWQIGNKGTNRGVLLLVVPGAEDYWCVQGAGLETRLPTSSISRILQQYMEPDFAVGNYDAGVRATAAALYDELAASFGVNRSASQVQATSAVQAEPSGGRAPTGRVSTPAALVVNFVSDILLIPLVMVILLVVVVVSAMLPRRRVYRPGWGWGGGPRPPRPPRPPYGGWGGGPRPPRPPMGGGWGGGRSSGGGGFTRGGGAGRSSFGGGRSSGGRSFGGGGRSSRGGGFTRGGGAGRGR